MKYEMVLKVLVSLAGFVSGS